MKSIKRYFDNQKSEAKTEAIRRWKNGESVQKIAKDLLKSRPCIYRWIKEADQRLSKNSKRCRQSVDELTHDRIIESYILLKKPSMTKLSKALAYYFHIQLSASQLRRLLEKWNLKNYQPSPLYDRLRQDGRKALSFLNKADDNVYEKENSHRWLERYEGQVVVNPPSATEDTPSSIA